MARKTAAGSGSGASRLGAGVLLVATSFLLSGYLGGVDCSYSRYQSVPTRSSSYTITGWVDSPSYQVCAHQYGQDNYAYPLGCVWPVGYPDTTDGCGASWYPYSLTVTLNSSSHYWNGRHDPAKDEYESTKVLVTRSGSQNASFYTATGDAYNHGPSNTAACFRSFARENSTTKMPLVFFREAVPSELRCDTPGEKSFAGCPFTCSLTKGCDREYGTKLDQFYNAAHRVNSEGQSTAMTRFDHRGATSSSGTPSGDWTYQYNSGACVGGAYPGKGCDSESECDVWYNTTGYCSGAASYILLRRNNYTADSLKLRRGANRRNARIDSWIKMKGNDVNNREIGLVQRWRDENNYFAFVVREYGGDYAKIHRYWGGGYANLAATTGISMDLIQWNRIGFEMWDHGSYSGTRFVPNGNCRAKGYLNGTNILYLSSTYCGFAPYGKYGPFSFWNSGAQFWDLNAYAR